MAGRGPAWQDKKDTLEKLEEELTRDKSAYASKEALINADITVLAANHLANLPPSSKVRSKAICANRATSTV